MENKNHFDLTKERESLGTVANLFNQFKIGTLLGNSGISNTTGAKPLEIFSIIFNLCFKGKNLFEGIIRNKNILLNKRHIYGFLNDPTYNWRKLLFLISNSIYILFKDLNSNPDEEVLILDDSPYDRSRSKFVELLSKVFDHNSNSYIKGFRMMTLGWSDGISFLGLDFNLLSSTKKKNRYCEANDQIDSRTCGGKRRREAVQKSTELIVPMVKRAITLTKVKAKRILMDSWYSYPKLIHDLKEIIDVICMVKDHARVYYTYKGKKYRLSGLYNRLKKKRGKAKVKATCLVRNAQNDLIKLVFVAADNGRGWLALLSTDTKLEDNEIIRLYGKRWDIEVFFKMCKHHLKLVKEIQLRNFDGLIAHSTVVMMRYNLLSYHQRMDKDLRSYSDGFREFFDELNNLSFLEALSRVLSIAMGELRKTVGIADNLTVRILETIMVSAIRFFNLTPKTASSSV